MIALDAALTGTGRLPVLDLVAQRHAAEPELLVGEDGAEAITQARARDGRLTRRASAVG